MSNLAAVAGLCIVALAAAQLPAKAADVEGRMPDRLVRDERPIPDVGAASAAALPRGAFFLAVADVAEDGPAPGNRPPSDGARGDRDRHFAGLPVRRMPPPDPRMFLAGRLAVQETLIGIRADQLDAWRAYTAAFLAVLAPPAPPPGPGAGGQGPDRQPPGEPGSPMAGRLPPPLPAFAGPEALAADLAGRAKAAEALTAAIAHLRTVLDPEQLALASQVGMAPPRWPGMPGLGNPGPGGAMGPMGGPERLGPLMRLFMGPDGPPCGEGKFPQPGGPDGAP